VVRTRFYLLLVVLLRLLLLLVCYKCRAKGKEVLKGRGPPSLLAGH
jgi:hypothetical protein